MSYNESIFDSEDVFNYIGESNDRAELLRIIRRSELQLKSIDRRQNIETQNLIDAGYIVDED